MTKRDDYFIGIIFVFICILTWGKVGSSAFNWALDLSMYAILRAGLPIYLMFKYPKEPAFKLLSAVCLLGIASGISDSYCYDTYDNIILFLKVVLTLMALLLLTRGFNERNTN